MRSANSYQDIQTPNDIEEERYFEARLETELREFDPEEAAANNCSYSTYRQNCIRRIRQEIRREDRWY